VVMLYDSVANSGRGQSCGLSASSIAHGSMTSFGIVRSLDNFSDKLVLGCGCVVTTAS
jgi:hypothetical protein